MSMTSQSDADAHSVIGAALRPTPLIPLPLNGIGADVYAKLETRQPTGSFKVRGALAACARYGGSGERIVTASAGNHGLGIAYAATRLGVDATVVVPETASPAKVAALRTFDIDLRQIGADYDAAEAAAIEIASGAERASGAGRFVSAYNDEHVVAGQGTIATEIIEQAALIEQLDEPATVVVPVGGGGLLAGVAQALCDKPGWSAIGIETAASRGCSAAIEAGEVVTVPVTETIADGLAGNLEPGSITPGLIAGAGARVHAVPEPAIRAAVRELATQHGLVVEGSGAVGLAAVREAIVPLDRRVILVLTGRNIAPTLLADILRDD